LQTRRCRACVCALPACAQITSACLLPFLPAVPAATLPASFCLRVPASLPCRRHLGAFCRLLPPVPPLPACRFTLPAFYCLPPPSVLPAERSAACLPAACRCLPARHLPPPCHLVAVRSGFSNINIAAARSSYSRMAALWVSCRVTCVLRTRLRSCHHGSFSFLPFHTSPAQTAAAPAAPGSGFSAAHLPLTCTVPAASLPPGIWFCAVLGFAATAYQRHRGFHIPACRRSAACLSADLRFLRSACLCRLDYRCAPFLLDAACLRARAYAPRRAAAACADLLVFSAPACLRWFLPASACRSAYLPFLPFWILRITCCLPLLAACAPALASTAIVLPPCCTVPAVLLRCYLALMDGLYVADRFWVAGFCLCHPAITPASAYYLPTLVSACCAALRFCCLLSCGFLHCQMPAVSCLDFSPAVFCLSAGTLLRIAVGFCRVCSCLIVYRLPAVFCACVSACLPRLQHLPHGLRRSARFACGSYLAPPQLPPFCYAPPAAVPPQLHRKRVGLHMPLPLPFCLPACHLRIGLDLLRFAAALLPAASCG